MPPVAPQSRADRRCSSSAASRDLSPVLIAVTSRNRLATLALRIPTVGGHSTAAEHLASWPCSKGAQGLAPQAEARLSEVPLALVRERAWQPSEVPPALERIPVPQQLARLPAERVLEWELGLQRLRA